jgi:hypothetical protein
MRAGPYEICFEKLFNQDLAIFRHFKLILKGPEHTMTPWLLRNSTEMGNEPS